MPTPTHHHGYATPGIPPNYTDVKPQFGSLVSNNYVQKGYGNIVLDLAKLKNAANGSANSANQ